MEALQGNLHKFIYTLQDAGGGFQVSLKDGTKTQRRTAGRFFKEAEAICGLRLVRKATGQIPPLRACLHHSLIHRFFFFLLMNQKTPLWTQHKENSKSPQQRSF